MAFYNKKKTATQKAANAAQKADIYQIVVERLLKCMEKGDIPWIKPWSIASKGAMHECVNYVTQKPYSMLNQMLLGFRDSEFITYKQLEASGGRLKQGAQQFIVVYWNTGYYSKKKTVEWDENKQEYVEKTVEVWNEYPAPFLKYYYVYDVEDCIGIKTRRQKRLEDAPRFKNAQIRVGNKLIKEYCKREKIKLIEGTAAYYRPSDDSITLPPFDTFKIKEEYYSTAFHEMIHSTGEAKRLNRLKGDGFGSKTYAEEEIVAELGAAFICAELEMNYKKTIENSTAYLQSWMKVMKQNPRNFVFAVTKSEKAARFIFEDIKL